MSNIKKILIVKFHLGENFPGNVIKKLRTYFKFDIEEVEVDTPKNIRRRGLQKNANDYLTFLENFKLGKECDYILGVTIDDLYVQDSNFTLGISNEHKHQAIISIYRLQSDDQDSYVKQIITEILHELGHLFGFMHCKNRSCVMYSSNTPADTENKGNIFCPVCSKAFEEKFSQKLPQKM